MNLEFKKPSISMDELFEASPCNWCLIKEICYEYCDAKMDWLRIFYGQGTFKELRELMRAFPTHTTSTTTVDYGRVINRKDSTNHGESKNSKWNESQLPWVHRKSKLFRTLQGKITTRIRKVLRGKREEVLLRQKC